MTITAIGYWGDDYLILFGNSQEAASLSKHYGVSAIFPDCKLIGLKNWDDFILGDAAGRLFTVPTVPLDAKYLKSIDIKFDVSKLRSAPDLAVKIKWYVTPIVFGGDPTAKSNITWVKLEDHVNLVKWWNQKYLELKSGS